MLLLLAFLFSSAYAERLAVGESLLNYNLNSESDAACLGTRGVAYDLGVGSYRLSSAPFDRTMGYSGWTDGAPYSCWFGGICNGYKNYFEVRGAAQERFGSYGPGPFFYVVNDADWSRPPATTICLPERATYRVTLGDDDCSDNDGYQHIALVRLDRDCSQAACFGNVLTGDADRDGVCDDYDACPGSDDRLDADGDGVPDGCDLCRGDDAQGDHDGDGVCLDLDVCDGDDLLDDDQDGIPDPCDPCLGDHLFGDRDADGICDDLDVEAPLSLTMTGTCPGPVDLRLTGATPGARVALVGSMEPGDTVVPAGPCAGLQTHLGAGATPLVWWTPDAAGELTVSGVQLWPSACGTVVEAIEVSRQQGCMSSNPLRLVSATP